MALIRKRVIAASASTFALAWGVIFVQLVSGHDPVLAHSKAKTTTATTVALIFGTLPIMTALFAAAGGIERLHSRFWVAAAVSFTGVCLVAAGAKGGISGDLWGYVLALAGAATWSAYSVAIAPLMTRYTASRISAYALSIGAVLLLIVAAPQLASQDYASLPSLVWVAYVFAVLGPLCLTNLLWFNSIERVGPSRASLYANLQPFLGAIFALLLLSESMTALQVGGGVLIAAGIVLSRRDQPDTSHRRRQQPSP